MASPINFVRGLFKTFSVAIIFGVIALLGVLSLFLFNVLSNLPEVSMLKEFKHPVASEVYSDEDKKIGEFTTERRYEVKFEAIPKHVIYSFIAAEDSRFYEHNGIDITGIFRAIFSNVVRARYAQGGSTITQQVARALLLATRKKELTRKVREMLLARRMEEQLSKNEILHLYLNEIYLGHGAFGIGAAAQNYFHKRVEDLSIAEGAMLAGLPQRPNEWNPFRNPHLAKRRQQYVLRRMVDENFITQEQGVAALGESLRLYELEDINNNAAPYFTEYVRQYLMNKYGSEQVLTQGFKVYTTVKYDLQKVAEKSVLKGLRDVDKRLGWRGVAQRIETPDKVKEFLSEVHEEILAKLSPVRILAAGMDTNDPAARKLAYDFETFKKPEGPYFGPTPVKEGELYRALVTSVDVSKSVVMGQIGETTFVLPFTGLDWVRQGDKGLKRVDDLLKPGDVIGVKIQKIDRKLATIEASLEQEPEVQGALLSYDVESGLVRAMIGGKDFMTSKFNVALQAKRQVGSTFKPLLYAAAIDKGFSPSSIVTDAPIVFKFEGNLDADNAGEDWRPHNYGGSFEGEIPLRLALIRSMNIPTVKLLNEITIDYAIQYARTLGITAALPRDLSIGLGSWSSSLEEVTRAYAIFPRLGKMLTLKYIKKVVDANGKTLEEFPISSIDSSAKTAETQDTAALGLAISPQTAYVMTDMLKGVVREGTGRPAAVVGSNVAAKTGTSNDHRDAWFVGYTPHIMTGVWIGYEKDKPLSPGETGGRAAAPIWVEYMQAAVPTYPKNDFPIPDDIVFAFVDKSTGRLANSKTPNRVRVAFKIGTVPNAENDNLPRIGEPGSNRVTTAAPAPGAVAPTTDDEPTKESETSDFLRQGYQE